MENEDELKETKLDLGIDIDRINVAFVSLIDAASTLVRYIQQMHYHEAADQARHRSHVLHHLLIAKVGMPDFGLYRLGAARRLPKVPQCH